MEEPDPPILSFSQRSKQLSDDSTVRCCRCNKLILMHATRCEHCGIHFSGEAWQFSPSTKINANPRGSMTKVFVLILILAIIIGLLLY